jgi:5-methylcytosine-specific restriction enzyme A
MAAKNILATTRYQRMRKRFLYQHPLCSGPDSLCERSGRVEAAVELDHIKRRIDGGLVFGDSNLQGLCKACHLVKTLREKGWREKRRIGLDGFPLEEERSQNEVMMKVG